MKKEEEKRKRKKRTNSQPKEEGEKKEVKSGQKVRLVLFVDPSCVFNYKKTIEL